MYFYLYKITNLINGKIYVGVHQTKNLDDGYLGSGSHICSSIKKYGKENFHKEILEFFHDAKSMFTKEREIVNEEFLKRVDVYNKVLGGQGGSPEGNGFTFKGRSHSDETKNRLSSKASEYKHSDETKEKMKRNHASKRNPEEFSALISSKMKNKSKSVEHKEKISIALKNRNKEKVLNGENHPLYGKKKPQLTCPYCNKCGGVNNMYRYHFENCKNKT